MPRLVSLLAYLRHTCRRWGTRRGRRLAHAPIRPCAVVLRLRGGRKQVKQKSQPLLSGASAAQSQGAAEISEVQGAAADAVEQPES